MPPNSTVTFPPVVYQDQDILVIDKPAGLIIQKSHTHDQPTLEQDLPDLEGVERKGIVHRLDRFTSGLMVIAQSAAAQNSLHQQFVDRTVEKDYITLVWGEFKDSHAIIDAPIARHPRYGYKYVVMEDGRPAKSEIWRQQVLKINAEPATLLKVRLHTGRTHQVRVHLQALGFPLVGDQIYGRRKDKTGIRQFLHASYLAFTHPTSGQKVTFSSPLPTDLQQFLDAHSA